MNYKDLLDVLQEAEKDNPKRLEQDVEDCEGNILELAIGLNTDRLFFFCMLVEISDGEQTNAG